MTDKTDNSDREDPFAALGDNAASESDEPPADEATTDTDTDDETAESAAFPTRLKLALLAVIARVRSELSQAADEIAPQLTSAVSGINVPKRAWKPLGLVAVLLVAAVALSGAPFATDDAAPGVETNETPVEGVTYENTEETSIDSPSSSASAGQPRSSARPV